MVATDTGESGLDFGEETYVLCVEFNLSKVLPSRNFLAKQL